MHAFLDPVLLFEKGVFHRECGAKNSLSRAVTGVLQLCSQCLQQPRAHLAGLTYSGSSCGVRYVSKHL